MSLWRCESCDSMSDSDRCHICGRAGGRAEVEAASTSPILSVSGDMRAETAIQALLLAVEAMRAQIQALAVRVTMLEESRE